MVGNVEVENDVTHMEEKQLVHYFERIANLSPRITEQCKLSKQIDNVGNFERNHTRRS